MVCANTNAAILSIICIVNLSVAIFYFIPFKCKSCHAIHDFVGSKTFGIISLDISLFLSALIATVAPDSWPRDIASQIWIVLSLWIFFYLIFDILWVAIFPLSALSLMGPVWAIIKDIIKSKWKYAFDVDASDGLIIASFVVLLLFTGIMIILLFYYKFLHRIYYAIVLAIIFMIAMKTVINNIDKEKICCDFQNSEDLELCPILFNWPYLLTTVVFATLGVLITMYKYEMLCFADRNKSKLNTDKHDSQLQAGDSKSTEFYNRIDVIESNESTNLLRK